MRTRGILGRWGSVVAGLLLLAAPAEAQRISPSGGGASLDGLTSDATALYPTTTDTRALGTTTKMWSDLFLASGAVVNFDNGDVTWTHAANLITQAGGDFALAAGLQYCISTDTGLRRDAAGSVSFTNCSTGHATGFGLGTPTPKTAGTWAMAANDVAIQALAAANQASLVMSGVNANLIWYNPNGTSDKRAILSDLGTTTWQIVRANNSIVPQAVYLSANVITDVMQIGSASVAGVNYISGTGDHTFSDGNIIAAVAIGTGSATYAAAPIGTVGSGTGVTVNATGDYRRVTYKATFTYAAFSAAALTADKTIYTLAAKQQLQRIYADVTAVFDDGAGPITAATMTCGKTAGGNEYLVSFDVLTAAITRGLADADLGTSINRANAIQGGDLPSWAATTAVQCRLTTVGANTNQLTAGTMVMYLVMEML